eukprot:4433620-Prymnesium_polylepis.2
MPQSRSAGVLAACGAAHGSWWWLVPFYSISTALSLTLTSHRNPRVPLFGASRRAYDPRRRFIHTPATHPWLWPVRCGVWDPGRRAATSRKPAERRLRRAPSVLHGT